MLSPIPLQHFYGPLPNIATVGLCKQTVDTVEWTNNIWEVET